MEKVRYMISDAANLVHVEAHVLRYWEEELELAVPRNEMGHRYYTRENIQEFQKIKELKEKGYQLKAIRMILHNGEAGWSTLPDAEAPAAQRSLSAVQGEQQVAQIVPVPQKASSALKKEPSGVQVISASQKTSPVLKQEHSKNRMMPAAQNASSVLEQEYSGTQMISVPQKESPVLKQEYQGSTSPEERMAQFRELMSDIVGHAISLNNEELSQNIGREVGERVLKEMNYLAREQENAQEERYRKLDAAIRGNIRKKALFSKEKEDKSEKKLSRKEKKKVAELPNPATT